MKIHFREIIIFGNQDAHERDYFGKRTKLYHANNNTPKENELEISAVSTAQMLCDKTFEYLQHIVLLTPDREPMADQSMNTTKDHVGDTMS